MPSNLRTPITVEIDIPITRRMKLHAVVDGDDTQIFHSRRLSEVFAFLLEHEIGQFRLVDRDADFRIYLRPPLSPKSKSKG